MMNVQDLLFIIHHSSFTISPSCQGNEAFRIIPFAEFGSEDLAHIDDDIPVGVFADGEAFQRPRGWAFEVDAGDVIARAVTRTFEFRFGAEPIRNAAEVRARRREGHQLFFGWL